MSLRCKQVAPKILQILMLLFVVVIVADSFALQTTSLNAIPVPQLSLYNDDMEDLEIQVPQHLSGCEHKGQDLHLVIRYYLKQLKVYHIPSSPSIFFKPDRAPPFLFQ